MEIKNITASEFDTVISSSGFVAVDFWAEWCGPCKMLSPVFAELAAELPSVTFYKINVDENPDPAIRFGITAIPCVLFFKDGQLAGRSLGFVDKNTLRKRIEEVL